MSKLRRSFKSRGVRVARVCSSAFLLLTGIVLSGCSFDPRTILITNAQLKEQTPFTQLDISQSWINAPGIVMVTQRGLRGASEQRVALSNDTHLPGENLIQMVSKSRNGRPGRFVFETFIRQIGGAPSPFTNITSGDLVTGEDDLGTYFWTELQYGNSDICVLGLRRVTSAQRILPGNASILDILIRNCVRGDVQTALAPLLSGSISTPPIVGTAAGQTRVLSPLAAPATH